MGLKLGMCTPADEIKRYWWWQYMTHMSMEKKAMTKKRSSDIFGQEKCTSPEKILATPTRLCCFLTKFSWCLLGNSHMGMHRLDFRLLLLLTLLMACNSATTSVMRLISRKNQPRGVRLLPFLSLQLVTLNARRPTAWCVCRLLRLTESCLHSSGGATCCRYLPCISCNTYALLALFPSHILVFLSFLHSTDKPAEVFSTDYL